MSSMISTNYTSKPLHSFAASDYSSDQESGWSFYLEQDNSEFLSGCESSSMVSDAACSSASMKHSIYVDHDLEDTASSPPQQQSDDELKQVYMNTKQKMMENRQNCQEYNFLNLPKQEEHEGIYCGNGIPQGKSKSSMTDEMELGERERNWTELGRKGLCLVPLSMLLNVSPNFVLSM